jgi:hypothetical protein
LERALVRGVRPEQKEPLIARLKKQPWLADVVVERGWFEDAREEMLALVDRDQNLPYDLLRALAWFEDPRADDRLMAELRGSRSGRVYGLVAALPRLRTRLDEAIEEIWRDRPLTFRSSGSLDSSVEVAARHGITEAVDFIVHVTRQRHPDRGVSDHMIMQLMGELVELPGITQRNRFDYTRIATAIRALPKDVKFEFYAVLGKYCLTTGGAE